MPTSTRDMNAGVMTMAYGAPSYIRMAKGMARSVRRHSPGTPIAIVSDRPAESLRRWFDIVVPLNPGFGPGLAQKLYLDHYTPFDRTLFVDSDMLFFQSLQLLWDRLGQAGGFGLFGYHLEPEEEHYAVDDLPRYMSKVGIQRMVMTNTGILSFDRTSTTHRVFDAAREIANRAESLGLRRHPAGFFNDEPIFGAVAEVLHLPLTAVTDQPLLALGCFGTEDMTGIDVRAKRSRYESGGGVLEPTVIHFNVESQQSKVYDRELRRLEFGRWLGATRLPDITTDVIWFLRAAGRYATRTLKALVRRVPGAPTVSEGVLNRSLRRVSSTAEAVEVAAQRSRTPFTFVQVGSNDGRTGDPLFATASGRDVRGLLIEPVPQLMERLLANYSGKRGLSFLNAALAAEPGYAEFHWVPPVSGDPIWVDQLGSFSREVILRHADEVPGLAERIETVTVECRTLPDVVVEHSLRRIDLLHIDAEGSDFSILRTIDFRARWAPWFIIYEEKHLGPDASAARELLGRAGYDLVELGPDVFAFRRLPSRVKRSLRRFSSR